MSFMSGTSDHQVKGWKVGAEVFETHSGVPGVLPKHFHDTYQIAITTRDPGEYVCDGRTWTAPPGSIIIFHPGDVHSTPGPCTRGAGEASKLIYVEASKMAEVAIGLSDHNNASPIFDKRVILQPDIIRQFHDVHDLSGSPASALEMESELLMLLTRLVSSSACGQPTGAARIQNRQKAQLVRDYVHSHYRENFSLNTLSELVHTSPFHLNRIFAREYGMPPHAFQTHIRVERAKQLLLHGATVAEVAAATGFYDQSHLSRYFKRIVGVSPSSYATGSGVSLQT
jgi:AraC-like DNA-binding protein